MDELQRAKALREQAGRLEEIGKVKKRLLDLIEISRDPYYDQYLKQMLRDLEEGKASPQQVQREMERTYKIYLERMRSGKNTQAVESGNQQPVQNRRDGQYLQQPEQMEQPTGTAESPVYTAVGQPGNFHKGTMEFKIGAELFAFIGSAFVLIAFLILGLHFLDGIWQGISLYAASLVVVLLGELLVRRISERFSLVITGIGIAGIYISDMVNFQVLHNIGAIAALVIALIVTAVDFWLGRKKGSVSIWLISLIGCYICFIPAKCYDTGLNLLVLTVILLLINLASAGLRMDRNTEAVKITHMIIHTIFSIVGTLRIYYAHLDVIYMILFIGVALAVLNLIYFMDREKQNAGLTVTYDILLGIMVIIFVEVGAILDFTNLFGYDYEMSNLFIKLLTEVVALAIAAVFFLLYGQNRKRWIQYYFAAGIIFMFNGFSDYMLETTIGILLIFVITRLLQKEKDLTVLDNILTVLFFLQGAYMTQTWYAVPFAVVAVFAAVYIKRSILFQEITALYGILLMLFAQFHGDFVLPAAMVTVLILFWLFTHLPVQREANRYPYAMVTVVTAGLLSLCCPVVGEWYYNVLTMILGAVIILLVFREQYGMKVKRKYLCLAYYFDYMILTAGFTVPIIVSIIWMIVAMGCVAVGFKKKDRCYRLNGLVVAGVVCLKLLIFDFTGITSFYRAILFLVVGVIALAISFFYIHLEKKENEERLAAEEVSEPEVTIVEEEKPEEAAMQDENMPAAEKTSGEESKAHKEEREKNE